jgi:exodeoxyribonuclease V gamma subunit
LTASGLTLVGVHDTDAATDWLLRELAALPLGPFDHPVVLAHHPALRRALTLGIARATGCAASIRFVSPTGWVDEIAGLEGTDGEWRTGGMAWRLIAGMSEQVALLPHSAQQIVESGDTIALLDLARAVALRFRAYLLHRPDLLLRWETSDALGFRDEASEVWQRALWRSLVQHSSSRSPAQVIADVRNGRFHCPDTVAQTLLVVADPTMPPSIRETLQAIATERDVSWCVLASAGIGADAIMSTRLRAATTSLTTLGLAEMTPREVDQSSLLKCVQGLLAGETGPRASLDDTLTLHACHSPLREIETLRERLIVAMEAQPDLRPHEVTLYVSSLETYLPAIDAVFGLDEAGLPRLPYEVAGRPFRDRSPVVFALLRLLEASEGRTTIGEISALLRLAPIADAAGFTELETAAVLSLATKAGIVWGEDGADRQARFDLAPLEAGTWRHGIDRLVLGIAMGRSDSPVGDVLPVSGDSAGNADLIGRIAGWTERLFALFGELRQPRAAEEWSGVLEDAIRMFVSGHGSDDFDAFRTLRSTIDDIVGDVARASNGAPVGIAAIRALLEQAFEDMAGEIGHLRGGMRVCHLEPGTVLPARVVLIAGMDDALYPRGGNTPAWDMLSDPAQDEDPDRRADALDAFRQAVGSASSRVHVAWTGFTTLRHEARAASIAVSELRDLVQKACGGVGDSGLVREEPAHPFSASHFSAAPTTGHVQSGARSWAAAAASLSTRGEERGGFADAPLDAPREKSRIISLSALAECFKDPTLYYCRRVLGMQMYEGDEPSEGEPQGLSPFGKNGVSNEFRTISWRLEAAQRRKDTRDCEEIGAWLQHQPEMPYGEEGRLVSAAVANGWWPQLEEMRRIDWRPPHPVSLTIGEWTIVGRLDRLTPDARVMECLYEIRPHSAVSQWVPHLVMNVLNARGEQLPTETRMDGASKWKLAAVANAEEELLRLCEFFDKASLAPQPVFRRTGCAWLEALGRQSKAEADEETRDKAFREARKTWHPRPAVPGLTSYPNESESPSSLLCWADRGFDGDPEFVALFEDYTQRVLLPYMRAYVAAEAE